MMTTVEDKDKRSISFKEKVSLDEFSKAMKHFGNAFKILAKREATYHDFTDWLVGTDFVDVSPSLAEINKMVESKT